MDCSSGYGSVLRCSRPKLKATSERALYKIGKRVSTFAERFPLLQLAAAGVQILSRGRSPTHPARVRKVAMSTHIAPQVLQDLGFKFRFDFRSSLQDWDNTNAEIRKS